MLSGVGPASHLAEHNIPVIASLPGVGEHLMDHAVVDVTLAETSGTSLNYLKPQSLWQRIKYTHSLFTYTYTGKGPLTTNARYPLCVVSFFFLTKSFRRLQRQQHSSVPQTLCCFHSKRMLHRLHRQRTQRRDLMPPTWSSSSHLWGTVNQGSLRQTRTRSGFTWHY